MIYNTIAVSRKELREMRSFFMEKGRKSEFNAETKIGRNTLWCFLKNGEATERVVTTVRGFIANYNPVTA